MKKMAEANKIAQLTGWDVVKVVQAMATGDGLGQLIEDLNQSANVAGHNAYEINGLVEVLGGLQAGFYGGASAVEVQRRTLADYARTAGRATGETDKLGNEIREMPDGKKIVIDAKTGEAYEEIDALEKKKIPTKTVPVKADTSEFDAAVRRIQRTRIKVNGEVVYKTQNGRLLQ